MIGRFERGSTDREFVALSRTQAQGLLLIVSPETLKILRVSHNSREIVGISWQDLLDQPLNSLVSSELCVQISDLSNTVPGCSCVRSVAAGKAASVCYQRNANDLLIVEIFPVDYLPEHVAEFAGSAVAAISEITSVLSLSELLKVVSTWLQKMLAFDTIQIFRFDQDWHAELLAKTCGGEPVPFTDDRIMMEDCLLEFLEKREFLFVMDSARLPVSLKPESNPNHENLDLSSAVLFAPPEPYLKNLSARAISMDLVLSVELDGELWGFIECSNHKNVSPNLRAIAVCRVLSRIFALMLVKLHSHDDANSETVELESLRKFLKGDLHAQTTATRTLLKFLRLHVDGILPPDYSSLLEKLQESNEDLAKKLECLMADWH